MVEHEPRCCDVGEGGLPNGAGAEESGSPGALGSVGDSAREWWGPDPEQSGL